MIIPFVKKLQILEQGAAIMLNNNMYLLTSDINTWQQIEDNIFSADSDISSTLD